MKKELQKGIKTVKNTIEKNVIKESEKNSANVVVAHNENAPQKVINVFDGVEDEIFIQFYQQEVNYKLIRERIADAYNATGHETEKITNCKVYIKSEENAAYYVINEKITGKVNLF